MNFRIGHGYDVHRLVPGRPLWLGGVLIPHDKGLLGHSDADVLIHAICDALLGALAAGDIGKMFPDTDQAYKDIDSKVLLLQVNEKMLAEGYRIGNIDATLIMEVPSISPYIDRIRSTLAGILGIGISLISVKATTTEGLGPEGRGEGIAAHAIALIFST